MFNGKKFLMVSVAVLLMGTEVGGAYADEQQQQQGQAQAQVQGGGIQVQVQAQNASRQQIQQQAVQQYHMEQTMQGQNACPAGAQVQSQKQ